MSFLNTFEQRGLFNLTRYLAIFLISIFMISMILSFLFLVFSISKTYEAKVTQNEVFDQINYDEAIKPTYSEARVEEKIDPNILPGIKIPFVLQKYFSKSENRNILLNRLNGLRPEKRQQYLDNMANIVVAGEKENYDPVKIINIYMKLEQKKLSKALAQKQSDHQFRKYLVAFILSMLALVALFSLILVLLAIERNTRNQGVSVV